tara:strand:+ start:87 stop:377 length:291 start_codon:yes stop_codon:yes gene_type:complete
MKKFLEGELSLPLSFWVFGFTGTLLMTYIGMFYTQDLVIHKLISLPWHIFIFVGVWRSSNNYKGPKIFSILAKIMLIFWSLSFVNILLHIWSRLLG